MNVYDLIDQAAANIGAAAKTLADAAAMRDDGTIVSVPSGGSLPTVLSQVSVASPASRVVVVELEPGGEYAVGLDFTPPPKDPTLGIVIRTRADALRPARIRGEWRHPDPVRGNYHFENVWLAGHAGRSTRALIQHGSTTVTRRDQQPQLLTYRGVIFDGAEGYRRGLLANSYTGVVLGSRFVNFYHMGEDAQAFCSYNGGANWLIADTTLEASTEVVMLGGGTAMSPEMVPENFSFERCRFIKPRAFQLLKPTAKNVFEIKAGVRISLLDCVLEQSWSGAQNGAGLVIKACHSGERNADGTPGDWVRTEHITVSDCVVSGVGVGMVLVGNEAGPTQRAKNITVRNTLFHDVGKDDGLGVALRVADGPQNVTLDGVAFDNAGNFCDVWPSTVSGVCSGWTLTNVSGRSGPYGFKGDATAAGGPTLAKYFPGIAMNGVRLVGTAVPGSVTIDEATLQADLRSRFDVARMWT